VLTRQWYHSRVSIGGLWPVKIRTCTCSTTLNILNVNSNVIFWLTCTYFYHCRSLCNEAVCASEAYQAGIQGVGSGRWQQWLLSWPPGVCWQRRRSSRTRSGRESGTGPNTVVLEQKSSCVLRQLLHVASPVLGAVRVWSLCMRNCTAGQTWLPPCPSWYPSGKRNSCIPAVF